MMHSVLIGDHLFSQPMMGDQHPLFTSKQQQIIPSNHFTHATTVPHSPTFRVLNLLDHP